MTVKALLYSDVERSEHCIAQNVDLSLAGEQELNIYEQPVSMSTALTAFHMLDIKV